MILLSAVSKLKSSWLKATKKRGFFCRRSTVKSEKKTKGGGGWSESAVFVSLKQ